MIRLIATDLDGTFLGVDAVASERNLAAVELAHRAGVHVVAATGRGWRSASKVLEPATRIDHAVCSNGALQFHRSASRVVRTHPIATEAVRRAIAVLEAELDDVGLGWEFAAGGFGWDDTFLRHYPRMEENRGHERMSEPPLDDAEVEFLKVLVSAPGHDQGELVARLAPVLPSDIVVTASGVEFLEITGDDVHKARGLQALCDDLGIDRADVVAFGDNLNDLQMLEWAGTSYAMANAGDVVLAAADAEAPHHAEDGFAQVVETLLG